MGVLFSAGKQRRSTWAGEPPVPSYLGQFSNQGIELGVGTDAALVVPTVWACVSLLANAVAMLPLETFRRTSDIPARIADPLIVTAPAADMTQSEWLHTVMVSLLLRGNAYGRIASRDEATGLPTQIELISPDAIRVAIDPGSGVVTYWSTRTGQVIPAEMVWHLRGMTLPGAKEGLSPVSYAAAMLGIDLSARKFATDFLDSGGIPKAILTTDQQIDQDKARTIKERVLAATRNREPLILGAGLQYTAIQVKPEESQFLATMQANVSQIARYFGVVAEMVGGSSGNSMTYSSHEQRGLEFLTYGVAFWLKRIEDAMFLLLPQPDFVRFDASALLRTDAETQAKVDAIQIASKTRVPSEKRHRDGLAPYTPAQQIEAELVPLTVTPMGMPKALVPVSVGVEAQKAPTSPAPASDGAAQNSLPSLPDVHFHIDKGAIDARAVVTVPEQPAPVVNVTVEPAAPAEVRVNVAAPEVRNVIIPPTPLKATTKRVERNSQGDITAIVED